MNTVAYIAYALSSIAWAFFEHYIFDVCDLHIHAPNFLKYFRLEYHGPMAAVVGALTVLLSLVVGWLALLLFISWLFVEDVTYIFIMFLCGATWQQAKDADDFGEKMPLAWALGLMYTLIVLWVIL